MTLSPGEGAPAVDAVVETGAEGCHHGNREPDCEAAGAADGDDGAAAERVRHCARNCGHDSPPVVPAD